MNSREPGHIPQQPGSGRAARLRRRKRKRIALFASFAVIILLIALAVVLLALEIAEASGKLKDNNGGDETTNNPDDTSGGSLKDNYIAAEGNYSINEGTLILVNSDHQYVFPTTDRLANVYDSRTKDAAGNYSYMCSFNNIRMDKTALTSLNKFMDAFYAATKNEYALVSDAYRTYDEQAAKNSEIKAGFSDHHTGYLVSVKFYENKVSYTSDNSTKFADAYTWLNTHAAEYGFVQRYPSSKSSSTGVADYTYCYRYVGMAHATYINANGLCLEDYVNLLKTSYNYGGEHLKITDAKGVNYEVYYIPKSTTIYVPASSGGYEISGDNVSGYIVTVTLN